MRQAKGIRKLAFPDILNTLKTLHFQTPYQNAGVQSFGDKGEREKENGEKTPFISTAVVNIFSLEHCVTTGLLGNAPIEAENCFLWTTGGERVRCFRV